MQEDTRGCKRKQEDGRGKDRKGKKRKKKEEKKWNSITNTSHMARWKSAPGRCGGRRKKRERRVISEKKDPPQPSL